MGSSLDEGSTVYLIPLFKFEERRIKHTSLKKMMSEELNGKKRSNGGRQKFRCFLEDAQRGGSPGGLVILLEEAVWDPSLRRHQRTRNNPRRTALSSPELSTRRAESRSEDPGFLSEEERTLWAIPKIVGTTIWMRRRIVLRPRRPLLSSVMVLAPLRCVGVKLQGEKERRPDDYHRSELRNRSDVSISVFLFLLYCSSLLKSCVCVF